MLGVAKVRIRGRVERVVLLSKVVDEISWAARAEAEGV